MKDIELPPLPTPDHYAKVSIAGDFIEAGASEEGNYSFYSAEDMQSYARAAVEADRAQRVPDGWANLLNAAREVLSWTQAADRPPVRDKYECGRMTGVRVHALADLHEAVQALAATPAQPAQQEPDCPRCNGSGEDPEGYFDPSRGPDGGTYDGPCRDCAGTGAAQHQEPPQPVERKPMTDEVVREGFAACGVGGINARLGFVEGVKFAERHHGIRE